MLILSVFSKALQRTDLELQHCVQEHTILLRYVMVNYGGDIVMSFTIAVSSIPMFTKPSYRF